MTFSQSTHLLMFLALETLMSIIRTGLPILVELIDLVNCYNFSISNDLTQMVNFPTQIPDCDSHSSHLLDFFLSSHASISSTMAFPPLGNSQFQFPLTFDQIHSWIPHFTAQLLMTILGSSVKWSDLVHSKKAQGKFIFSFPYTLFF